MSWWFEVLFDSGKIAESAIDLRVVTAWCLGASALAAFVSCVRGRGLFAASATGAFWGAISAFAFAVLVIATGGRTDGAALLVLPFLLPIFYGANGLVIGLMTALTVTLVMVLVQVHRTR